MKRLILFSMITLGLLVVACNKKTMPVITERKADPPDFQKKIATVAPDTVRGRIVFTSRCGKCHDLPLPSQYSAQRWDGILSYMIPRASLDPEQGVHVTAYLKANAAK